MEKGIAILRKPAGFIAAIALVSFTGPATAQTTAAEAADAAEIIAQEAQYEIRAIDPTTGGRSMVVDPSLPAPYGADLAPEEIELPPLAENELEVAPLQSTEQALSEAAPRGPAARMISNPVVQTAPAPTVQPVSSDPFVIKSILPIEGSIRYGEWYWDESRAPKTGKLVMTVDLDARVISVFRDGHEIGTAVALLGTRKHPTPLGTFPILTKEKDNVSEKYNNAPMPWTLRLTWDGIAIHGSPVLNGYASHGCIGVPDQFAEKLFAIAKRGDKVVITRGKMIGMGDKII